MSTWKPKGVERLLFKRGKRGWHWTRRAEYVYTAIAWLKGRR